MRISKKTLCAILILLAVVLVAAALLSLFGDKRSTRRTAPSETAAVSETAEPTASETDAPAEDAATADNAGTASAAPTTATAPAEETEAPAVESAAPVESAPPVTATAVPVEAADADADALRALSDQIDALRAQYVGSAEALIAACKNEYQSLPAEEKTPEKKLEIVSRYTEQADALEAQCDAEVSAILSQLAAIDPALAAEASNQYQMEKATTKSNLLSMYS